jgi:hypothetical protein
MLTVVKKFEQAELPSQMANPVEALWVVELLYGKHPSYTENTYAVKFTTKLEGGASKCFLVIDLRDRFDEFLRELNVFGCMEKNELHKTIDYVKCLKINGLFRRVPNLQAEMEGSANIDESLELFELVSGKRISLRRLVEVKTSRMLDSQRKNKQPLDDITIFAVFTYLHTYTLLFCRVG